MARASPLFASFNAGEFSPRLEGRADLEKYASGCRTLENWLPLVQGPLSKRPGTRYIATAKDSTKPVLLISFEFSTEQQYILAFGNQTMRVFMDGGVVLDSTTLLPYEIATPYIAEDLSHLIWAQSADVLFLAHPGYAPRKLSRTGHDAWTLTEIAFSPPPFAPENTNESLRLFISASTGSGVTLNSTASLFTADDVGRIIRLREVPAVHHETWAAGIGISASEQVTYEGNVYRRISGSGTAGTIPPTHDVLTQRQTDGITVLELDHYGFGYVEITAFTSDQQVTVDVINRVPETYVGTADNDPGAYTHYERFRWSWGAFDDIHGYPRAVTFHEDRLWWAGTNGHPQTLWASRTHDYESHRVIDDATSALQFTMNFDQVNVVHWLSPAKNLVIGTSSNAIVAPALNQNEGIAPENPLNFSENQSAYGVRGGVQPLRVENALLFPQRSGQKLRELLYNFDSDSYLANDANLYADHITLGVIRQMAYQQDPSRIVWCALESGEWVGLTYERSQQVFGWHRHVLGGTDSAVESVAVLRGDVSDEVWLVGIRTINGSTVRTIERMEQPWVDGSNVESAFFVDCGLSYNGVPADVISGLDHLEGETVQVLADGAVHPDRVVTGGSITLAHEASVVHVGLGYDATYQSMKLEAGARGTAQGKTKRIYEVVFRLHETGAGLFFGHANDLTKMYQVFFRQTEDPTGEPVPLFTGDTEPYSWPGGFERDGRITVKHVLPLPATLIAILPESETR